MPLWLKLSESHIGNLLIMIDLLMAIGKSFFFSHCGRAKSEPLGETRTASQEFTYHARISVFCVLITFFLHSRGT